MQNLWQLWVSLLNSKRLTHNIYVNSTNSLKMHFNTTIATWVDASYGGSLL
jgi:hypothetical protein